MIKIPSSLGSLSYLSVIFLLFGCFENTEVIVSQDIRVIRNPFGIAPLTAILRFDHHNLTCQEVTSIEVTVRSKDGNSQYDLTTVFDPRSEAFKLNYFDICQEKVYNGSKITTKDSIEIPVAGLYIDHSNVVDFKVYTTESIFSGSHIISIGSIDLNLPEVKVNVPGDSISNVMILASHLQNDPVTPFIFDQMGNIRWAIDFKNKKGYRKFFYDNGIERLANGNFYMGRHGGNQILEMTVMGEILNYFETGDLRFHHNVQETESGGFLATVNSDTSRFSDGSKAKLDLIVEVNRDNTIMSVWDMKEIIDESRPPVVRSDPEHDWLHANAVIEDFKHNSIIVSGRNQGLIKFSREGKLKWVLAPHKGWGINRSGINTSDFLLKPLDKNGDYISDSLVIQGLRDAPDFRWPFGQHSPLLLQNGNIMMFDNGNTRNFTKDGEKFTRVVEYEIDETLMTIKQVWEFGVKRGREEYNHARGDVDILMNGNILITYDSGTIREVSREGEILYEVSILKLENSKRGLKNLHRAELLSLHP